MKKLRIILSFKRSIIGNDVDVQRDFLRDLDSLVHSKKQILNKRVEDLVAKNPEDEQEIYDHYYEEFLTFDTRYVELSNNSQLVNSYSFLEFELRGIRDFLKKYLLRQKSQGYFYDRKKSVALNYRDEIYSLTFLDFSVLDELWDKIDKYRRVRNVIVHNGGNIREIPAKPLSKQPTYSLVSDHPFIDLNSSTGLIFVKDWRYVEQMIELIGKYLKQLINILLTIPLEDVQ